MSEDGLRLAVLGAEAVRACATYIHIAPTADGAMVRLRVGDDLVNAARLVGEAAQPLLEELAQAVGQPLPFPGARGVSCVQSDLGLRYIVALAPQGVACRIAGVPGLEGEAGAVLGAALARRSGLVLIAGPKGSGRSTTLAAAAAHLAARDAIALGVGTAPNPALARIEGAPEAALQKALGLDADIVAIDELGAGTAAASVAGARRRLVLAVVGARDAVSAIAALRRFGVNSFSLATALSAVTAQRLVKRLCARCRRPVQASNAVSALLGFDSGTLVYEPGQCGQCARGFAGRVGIFEAVANGDTIARLINAGGDDALLANHAFVRSRNLGSAARQAVRDGLTTVEEAVRISRDGDDG